ncbi:MAG: hypothetical protein ABIN99_00935 [Nitrosospira sp.]
MKNSIILAIALMMPAFAALAEGKAKFNDAQIAAIVVAANQVAIDAGKAQNRNHPTVKSRHLRTERSPTMPM